jgi:hypothetical protein
VREERALGTGQGADQESALKFNGTIDRMRMMSNMLDFSSLCDPWVHNKNINGKKAHTSPKTQPSTERSPRP